MKATHVGYHDDYGWGGAEWGYGGQQIKLLVQYLIFGMSMMVMLLEVQHTQIAHHAAPWQRPRIIQACW